MIILMKKRNVALVALILLLCIAIYSVNVLAGKAVPVTGNQDGQKVVIIDAGHGGEDPGAVSDYSGLKEKDVNLLIAHRLKEVLESDGYKVIMTREEDKLEYPPETRNITQKRYEDLTRRKKIMDEAGGNIAVSIHMNKFPQTQYFGAQTFYPPKSPDSQKLATLIQDSLIKSVDPNNIRVAKEKNDPTPIVIFRDIKTPTVVVECGFLSNAEEEKKLAAKEYQEKIVLAIKDGINKYFEK